MKEADAWFTDHFGFRSFLIRANAQFDYSVFHTSSRVHIGKDNQLFYRWVLDIEKPKIEYYLRARAAEIVENVRLLHSALASRGIRFALSINLTADRYLPENLPASAPHYRGPQQIDSLIAQLDKQLGPDYFDVTPILREAALKHPIFHKTDFHWNSPSARWIAAGRPSSCACQPASAVSRRTRVVGRPHATLALSRPAEVTRQPAAPK